MIIALLTMLVVLTFAGLCILAQCLRVLRQIERCQKCRRRMLRALVGGVLPHQCRFGVMTQRAS